MKIILLLLGISFISCNSTTNKSEDIKAANFDWLLGGWKRTNEVAGKETFENWKKVNENEYTGEGITIQNKDTIFHEIMTFYKSGEHWDLSVKNLKEVDSTIFKGVSNNESEFTCENKEVNFLII